MLKNTFIGAVAVYVLGAFGYAIVLIARYWGAGWSVDAVLLNAFHRSLTWPIDLAQRLF